MKQTQKKVVEALAVSGWELTTQNAQKVLDIIKSGKFANNLEGLFIYIDPSWQTQDNNPTIEHGINPKNGKWERETRTQATLTPEQDAYKILYNYLRTGDAKGNSWKQYDANNLLIGKAENNKPKTLEAIKEQAIQKGFSVYFMAYKKGEYYPFTCFKWFNGKAQKGFSVGRVIDTRWTIARNEEARKDASEIYYLMISNNYFNTINAKQMARRGNEYGYIYYKHEATFSTDRILKQYIIENRSCVWNKDNPNEKKYHIANYSWTGDTMPTDKSGYFMPYFIYQLEKRLKIYKQQQAKKRYNSIDKTPYQKRLDAIKEKVQSQLDVLFKNGLSLATCKTYAERIKDLADCLGGCVVDFSRYDDIGELENTISRKEQRAEKVLYFSQLDVIANKNPACLHQYEKQGDGYTMTSEYINTWWAKDYDATI